METLRPDQCGLVYDKNASIVNSERTQPFIRYRREFSRDLSDDAVSQSGSRVDSFRECITNLHRYRQLNGTFVFP
jgi:hypothetical protein